MYSFKNDYSESCHPDILKSLAKINMQQEEGYGYDSHTINAISKIRKLLGDKNAYIHFISGGTQANLIVISAFLKPHEACVCANTGHIATHETGAIEYTGHKIITVTSKNGKLTPEQIEKAITPYNCEHFVKPKLVYISNATEIGTVYTKEELKNLNEYCKSKGLILFADGARLGSALSVKEANLTLKDMYDFTDAFYIGGTKNGALLGEAIVIRNEALRDGFKYNVKQKGGLLAKGQVLGIQFETLFKDNLYFDLANHANEMAKLITKGLKEAGIKFLTESLSNQIFPILKNEVIEKLEKKFGFYIWEKVDENYSSIRLVTSWATKKEEVLKLIEEIKKLNN
ncbi:threonine aldolase family protein [Clostridium oceanicum]|uniref:threonine aldolase family protein n=1 Tax=Clostridium oceanicum TaxID=1543 RepID=UPI0031E27244